MSRNRFSKKPATVFFPSCKEKDPEPAADRCHLPIRITKKEGFIFNQAGAESVLFCTDGNGKTYFVTVNTSRLFS